MQPSARVSPSDARPGGSPVHVQLVPPFSVPRCLPSPLCFTVAVADEALLARGASYSRSRSRYSDDMPNKNGVEAALEIRQLEMRHCAPATPIVCITANDSEGHKQRCADAGMNAFLVKPITLEQLTGIFAQLEAAKEQQAAQRAHNR